MTIYGMIYFDSNKALMIFEFNVKLKDKKNFCERNKRMREWKEQHFLLLNYVIKYFNVFNFFYTFITWPLYHLSSRENSFATVDVKSKFYTYLIFYFHRSILLLLLIIFVKKYSKRNEYEPYI